jgi:uncharacterized membrane protein
MDQIITLVGMFTNFLVGYITKKSTKSGDFIRKVIPALTFVVALITQMVAAATSALPPQTVPAVAMAGFFGTFGKGFLDIFVNSLIQTFVVTGVHSTQKNAREALR